MATDEKTHELVVVGAGPGGYPAAFHAADLGLDVTFIDPEPNPGGVCLFRGCVPSKALLHVVSFLHEIEQAQTWGVTIDEPTVDVERMREWKDSVVKSLTEGLGKLSETRNIDYIRGWATLRDPHHLDVKTHDGEKRTLAFDQAILAAGSKPSLMSGVPDSDRIMTSEEALDVRDVPERLLVVGAGYIGLELGQVYAAVGADVSVAEMLPQVLPGADRDLVRFLAKRIEKQFERIMTGTTVRTMEETDQGIHVTFEGENGGDETFDKVMIAVGRTPRTEGLGLEKAGIMTDERGFIQVDERQRTDEPSIFAVGDVVGQPMLAHKATYEGKVAAEATAGKSTVYDARTVPAVVFSDPEIAWCGLTENQAKEQGRDVVVRRFPWAASGRAATISRKDGMTKMLCNPENGRILGVGIAGKNAGELIGEATLAVEMASTAEDVALTIHTHPTLSETLMEAAEAFAGTSTHVRKKAVDEN